jgi:hypothetical protein
MNNLVLSQSRHALLGATAPRAVDPARKKVALAFAAVADIVQWALVPLFVEGAASPFEIALDAAVGLTLLLLLGFHWRLAFAIAVELIPGADMFPTWTAMVATLPSAKLPPQLPPSAQS